MKKRMTGYGAFPMDMLRYDCCWPYSPEDVETITESLVEKSDTPRVVTICFYKGMTLDRWISFGWMPTVKQ